MGVGATLHHIGLCLVTAHLSNRTMILDCSGWAYSSKGWDAAFLPITNCTQEHMLDDYITGEVTFYTHDFRRTSGI